MFDDVIRELKCAQKSWRLPIPTDDEGYLDRCCPSEGCHQWFKLLCDEEEGELPEREFCPFCGVEDDSEAFLTPHQRDYIEKVGIAKAQEMLDGVFKRAARRSHTRPPTGDFISITLSYKPSAPPIIVPLEAADIMQQKFACEQCNCRYAAVGTAFSVPHADTTPLLLRSRRPSRRSATRSITLARSGKRWWLPQMRMSLPM